MNELAQTTARNRTTSARMAMICAVLTAFAIALPLYSWWFSDERAIRAQLTTIASALSVQPGEGDLGPVTRAAALRKTLAADIRISAGAQEVVSRDAVLGRGTRWIAPAGGLAVGFVKRDGTWVVGTARTEETLVR